MKRYLLVLLMAVAVFGIVGCNQEDGSTLKWTNNSDTALAEINWGQGSGNPDQTWGYAPPTTALVDNYPIGSTTEKKNIELLLGLGDALDNGGVPYAIELTAGEGVEEVGIASNPANARIKENADALLIITAGKK